MKQGLKRGLMVVFLANAINLIINLLSGFILPKGLSVETYAGIKTFQLYASYTGLLHFGFVDGIYLKYGGKSFKEVNPGIIQSHLSTMRLFQIVIVGIGVVFGILTNNYIFTIFALCILPTNILAFFQYLYQAIGEFDAYSRILNGTNILKFAINMLLLFVIRTDDVRLYIIVFLAVEVAMWVVIEYLYSQKTKCQIKLFEFSIRDLFENIKTGITLTIGNLSSIFLTSMDRWFIKFLLNTAAFAQYSFAVSMENLLSVAITPITVTLYNYFCKEDDSSKIRTIRNGIQVFGAYLIAAAFPAKFILEVYLQKYLDSVNVMFLLFGSQLFYVVIKGVYVNIYKAHKEQSKYFIRLLSVVGIGFILNIVCYLIYRAKEAFAVGTMLSAFVWLILCVYDNKDIGYTIREFIYLIIQEILFLLCGMYFKAVSGFFLYVLLTSVVSFTLLKQDFLFLINNASSVVRSIVHKS